MKTGKEREKERKRSVNEKQRMGKEGEEVRGHFYACLGKTAERKCRKLRTRQRYTGLDEEECSDTQKPCYGAQERSN